MKLLAIVLLFYSSIVYAETEQDLNFSEKKIKLDQKILFEDDAKGIDTLFKNMIVVQKKAIQKNGSFFFDTHFSFDFSDNPKTMYSPVFGFGFIYSDNYEIGLTYAPMFLTAERSSVKIVRDQTLSSGANADLYSPSANWELGGSWLWNFAYGKDAFGPYSIIRSETFLKLFLSKIQFNDGLSGSRYGLLAGKTFTKSKNFNMRLSVGFAILNSYINQKSQSSIVGLIEPGLIWYF